MIENNPTFTLKEFKNHLTKAHQKGTLLIDKHNPFKLESNVFHKDRTTISGEVANNLTQFLTLKGFTVTEYHNHSFESSPLYFVVENNNSKFNILPSGITANSSVATSIKDSLLIVSGTTIGFHIYGEDISKVNDKKEKGTLSLKGILK